TVTWSCKCTVEKIEKLDGAWALTSRGNIIRAAKIINAAGAWAGEIAKLAGALPIDIQPMRRTMVQLSTNPPSTSDMPLVVALDGSFYFKPEAGGSYWLSPHDETPADPCDAAPDDSDVAVAI